MRSPEEIENERVEKLKEINTVREQLNIVCKAKHDKEKEIEDLREAIRQAKHTLAVKNTEEKILESEFWASRK